MQLTFEHEAHIVNRLEENARKEMRVKPINFITFDCTIVLLALSPFSRAFFSLQIDTSISINCVILGNLCVLDHFSTFSVCLCFVGYSRIESLTNQIWFHLSIDDM